MVTATKPKTEKSKPSKGETIQLNPIRRRTMSFVVKSLSPMIQHQWSEKAKQQMRDKHAGKKTKTREVRGEKERLKEAEAATYVDEAGRPGIPVLALKASIISAAHKDIGVDKTLVRKALFFPMFEGNGVVPFTDADEPIVREDCVRVGQGSTDLRYRPEFKNWEAEFVCDFDEELLTVEVLTNLINRAGFGVGIGEWRPEKGGEYGRFEITSVSVLR